MEAAAAAPTYLRSAGSPVHVPEAHDAVAHQDVLAEALVVSQFGVQQGEVSNRGAKSGSESCDGGG